MHSGRGRIPPHRTRGQESLIATTWGSTPTAPHRSPHLVLDLPCITHLCYPRRSRSRHSGAAELRGAEESTEEMIGEVVVDSNVLYHHEGTKDSTFTTGVRMVATADAPGLAAVQRPAARGVANKKLVP